MSKEIKINVRPSRKYDGMKYRVRKMVGELQKDGKRVSSRRTGHTIR